MIRQLWSCPAYGDQLGFIDLSLLVWIILQIYTHTYAQCLFKCYTLFLMTWFHLHTPGGGKEKEMEKLILLWCVCFLYVSKIFYRYRHLKMSWSFSGVFVTRVASIFQNLKRNKSIWKNRQGASGGSGGRAGAPYTEVVSSPQRYGFDSTCDALLHVIPPLTPLFPVYSSAVLSKK